jgi:EmrB/QacA subfamily drug resistance transporter
MDATTARDRRWIALILLCAAQFMVVLDASIVNVALPSIQKALGFSQENLPWVVNAYVLVFGGFLLLGGRAADLLGRRRVFIFGLLLFAAASLAGGLAESQGMLIAARAVQGLGAAILSPAALSIITTTFAEGPDRNKALGVWGAVAGSGGAVGVLLGGVLTDGLGWEWVLFVNVPIGLAAAAAAPLLLAESRREGLERNFDVLGALTSTAGLIVLVYAVIKATDNGWGSATTLGLIALSLVLLAVFAITETRARQPLMPFRIFRQGTVAGANATALLTGAALFSMFFFISLYMQQILGYSALDAGLAYLPLAVSIIVAATIAGGLVTRMGARPVLVGGLVLTTAGLLWFSQVPVDGSYVANVLGPMLLAGWGLGLSFVPVTIASQAGVTPADAGLAGGLINVAQQIGGALGLAVLSTVATSTTKDAMTAAHGARGALPAALTDGFNDAFLVGAGIAAVAAVVALVAVRTIGNGHGEAVGPAAAADPAPEQARELASEPA